ncbi:MAG TPA: phosphatidylglycerophosphatase A [Pseudomonadota bacterium]|nr:phosphatidylglycerophosphatase A [Pseudomonadota bacterium]
MSQARDKPSFLVAAIATFLFAGHSKVAPGTMGSLAALPLAWVLLGAGPLAMAMGVVVVTLLGTWAAGRYCEATGRHDNQRIVIDEVAGILITLWPVSRSLGNLAVGFLLFRLFDIWKPGPVRIIDRRVGGGFGVMADDLAAGLLAAVCLWLIQPSRLPFAIPGWSGS